MKEIYRPIRIDPNQALAGYFPSTSAKVLTSFTMASPSQPALLACPACMPRLLVVIAGLGPRGCIQYPTYSEAPAGPCSQHVQPSFLSGEITLWNLTFLCLLTGPVEQWSPWDHRKHMFAIKSLWDPHGPRMSNKLSFLFYFFFSMGIGVCFFQMTFFFKCLSFGILRRMLKGLVILFSTMYQGEP